jgi:hypothetical protein
VLDGRFVVADAHADKVVEVAAEQPPNIQIDGRAFDVRFQLPTMWIFLAQIASALSECGNFSRLSRSRFGQREEAHSKIGNRKSTEPPHVGCYARGSTTICENLRGLHRFSGARNLFRFNVRCPAYAKSFHALFPFET